ncbi:hypothetical protein KR084_004886 [Drosophila pseudotakahashii]|nr:hypothetical protein KR084_004886 [Drosophila pseudotakahashii]
MSEWIVKTIRDSVVGTYPSCHVSSRLEERRARKRAMGQENSGSNEETPQQREEVLNTSYNLCDFLSSRESGLRDRRSVNVDYTSRYVLTNHMLRETPIDLGYTNKVYCSQWLNSRQVVFGTKCSKLLVYDVNTRRVDAIPPLPNSVANRPEDQKGLHVIELSPSRSFLATTTDNASDIAVYRLPTLKPVYEGKGRYRDLVRGMCWLDDQLLVSGSIHGGLVMWRINEDHMEFPDSETTVHPLKVKQVYEDQTIWGLCFNKKAKEIASLAPSRELHIFNAETFQLTLSRILPNAPHYKGIVYHSDGLYAVRYGSFTIVLDARTLETVKKISVGPGEGQVLTTSFEGNLLTAGTSRGLLLFYDIRAGKYLESSVNSLRSVALTSSPIILDDFMDTMFLPSIFTHCYDSTRMRLFAAGGPISFLKGNYAAVWQ